MEFVLRSILLRNGLLDEIYNINIMLTEKRNIKMYRRTSKSLGRYWFLNCVAIDNISALYPTDISVFYDIIHGFQWYSE